MEKDLNTITFEYQKPNKTSLFFKLLSVVLIIVFLFNPLSEFVDVFRKSLPHGWCCQPNLCNLSTYHFL